jgi:Ca-activated chloride channel family protein
MEEATLLDFNSDRAGQPRLVAIYPKEGTFYSDNPFYVLTGDWVTPQQRAGAEAFQRFLADRITPEVAAQAGFRPPDPEQEPLPPISPENGADPAQPVESLSMPSAPVLAAIRKAWRADRKPANVMIAVDVSGSMGDADRLPKAIEGLGAFLDEFQSRDRIGLTTFNERVDELVPIAPFRDNEPALRRSVARLTATGGTAFLDATSQSVARVQESAGKGDRINAVVVLSDGEDTDSAKSLSGLLRELSTQNPDSQVRVFTIAYAAEAAGAAEALMAIAESSGGQYYEGGTDEITRLFRSISSFF